MYLVKPAMLLHILKTFTCAHDPCGDDVWAVSGVSAFYASYVSYAQVGVAVVYDTHKPEYRNSNPEHRM